MPTGRVLRIDPGRETVHIERVGRTQEAVLVTADALDVTTRPVRLVRQWLADLATGDMDRLLDLYRSSAVVHLPRGLAQGPAAIGSALDELGWTGAGSRDALGLAEATVRSVDQFVVVDPAPGTSLLALAFAVGAGDADRGEIVEQWIGIDPAAEPDDELGTLVVVRRGAVSDAAVEYAREKVAHLLASHGLHATSGRLKFTHSSNPANDRPSSIEVMADMDGALTRAHATAATMPEAIDEVVERLRVKLDRLVHRHRAQSEGRAPEHGEWRHGNRSAVRHPWFDRPVDEREVVRHKSFAPARLTLDDALWDLGLLDYDFFLFVEARTGIDCVVERGSGDEVIVHGLADRPEVRRRMGRPGVSFSERPVPVLDTRDAIELLEGSGERFELFEHPTAGRRRVVYRRYDGHYGLITPPDARPPAMPSEERAIHEGVAPGPR